MGWGQDILGIGLHGSATPRAGFLPPSRFEPLGHFIPELEDAIVRGKVNQPDNESSWEPGDPWYDGQYEDPIEDLVSDDVPCVARFAPPWDSVDTRCFLEGETAETIDSLCPPPCADSQPWLTPAEIAGSTDDLNITHEDMDVDDLTELIECAWALLVDNADVIDWIVCTLSADPRDGDCILEHLFDQDVRISIVPGDDGVLAVVADAHIELDGFSSPLQLTKIKVWAGNDFAVNCLGAFRAGGGDAHCGCISMAAALLHELSHVCWRDVGDAIWERTCPFAVQIESSFIWAMLQRYPTASESSCCAVFTSDTTSLWWSTDTVDFPLSSCFEDDLLDLPPATTGGPVGNNHGTPGFEGGGWLPFDLRNLPPPVKTEDFHVYLDGAQTWFGV